MSTAYDFNELVEIFKKLRDPENGCPWDLKQTHQSLTNHLIEESYELVDAINKSETSNIREELGDVLLQVMLHSQIAADNQDFNVHDVIQELSEKLVERHPHVFGEVSIDNAEDVKKNWDKIKRQKKSSGVLAGIPKAAPALLKAELMGKKTEAANFDWDDINGVKEKVAEEVAEFLAASNDNPQHFNEEFGDLLFTLVQLARKLKISSEESLQAACNKFQKRFEHMEESANKDLSELPRDEIEILWQKAKSS